MKATLLTVVQARQIAVGAQLLTADRPRDFLAMVSHLTFLQLDPTAVVAPSADLISWSRMGSRYKPEMASSAVEVERTLFEEVGQDDPKSPAVAKVRPMSDLGLYLAEMALVPRYQTGRDWLQANTAFGSEVLARLRSDGPLPSREIADTSQVSWVSTGWTNSRNVTRMLEILLAQGKVAVAGRKGRQRTFDLAERVFPGRIKAVPLEKARVIRNQRRLRSLGIARSQMVGTAGQPARVEGSSLEWRVDPEALDRPFTGRTALLSPFDRLIHDRIRALEVFGFEYVLEMYKPVGSRRWGYFALPILHHDRLVGKLDITSDRKAGALRVNAIHKDFQWTKEVDAAVEEEIEALAAWLELKVERT